MNLERLALKLDEPSTWRGIADVLGALSVFISPDQTAAIVGVWGAIRGIIGAFVTDKK